MIYLVTALYSEARPLIEYYKLKHDHRFNKISIYRNDDMALVVSGIGKIKSATVTGIVLSEMMEPDQVIMVNVGIAGGTQDHKIGQLFLINKILDQSSKHFYYPDLLIKHLLEEEQLVTVDKPQLNGEKGDYLVDMEASGFFEAANIYLPPSQIGCLKVVSDHRKNVKLSRDIVSELIEKQIPDIDNYLNDWHSFITNQRNEILTGKDQQLIVLIKDNLRLTITQGRQFEKLATKYKIESDNLDILKSFQEIQVQTKKERNRIFERIRTLLR